MRSGLAGFYEAESACLEGLDDFVFRDAIEKLADIESRKSVTLKMLV